MTQLKAWLSGLLALQLIIIAAVFVVGTKEAKFDEEEALVAVAADEINKITITDGEGKKVTLERDGSNWAMPDYGGLDATSTKVESVLEKISDSKISWPVASSESSHTRFEVSDEKFQRKIELYSDSKVVETLYLGTSPGYRSVHARRSGNMDVFAIKMASHDFPTTNEDWFEKSILAAEDVTKLTLAGFSVEKTEDEWVLRQSLASEETSSGLDQDKVKELASSFSTLRVQALAPEAVITSPLSVKVSAASGDFEYQLSKTENDYFIRRSDIDQVFKISETSFKKIDEADLPSIVAETEESEKTAEIGEASQHQENEGS